MARACWASSRNGLTMISEITQPTSIVVRITPEQIQNTRQCSESIRAWVSAIGAPSAIDALPVLMVRIRYSTPSMVASE